MISTAAPSHPPALDAPRRFLAQARPFFSCHSSYTLTQGSGQIILYCAHRTSTVSSCAFCEQEGWSGRSLPSLPRARAPGAKRSSLPLASSLFLFVPSPYLPTREGSVGLGSLRASASPPHLPLSAHRHYSRQAAGLISTAAVERAQHYRARSGSKEITLPPASSHLFQNVPHLLLFRSQILHIRCTRLNLDRHALDDS